MDNTVRSVTGAQGKCPEVWPVVKAWLGNSGNQDLLIQEIKNKLVDPCQ